MPSIEEQFREVKKEVGTALPEVPTPEPVPETVDGARDRQEWLAELKENVDEFIRRGDTEGLLEFVRRMVHIDTLTNVLNRAGFTAEAEARLDRIAQLPEGMNRRSGEFLTFNILFIDLDKFKNINDTYGHAAGDAALVKTGEILMQTLREDDIIGRWGGEEFVVAFSCSSQLTELARHRVIVAEKVRRAFEETDFIFEGQKIPLTASIGAAQRREGEEALSQIVQRADKAMYVAKQRGRNRVAVAEEEGILPPY